MQKDKSMLVFNGYKHPLASVLAKLLPAVIKVAAKDIELNGELNVRYRDYTSSDKEPIVFYRHNGKYLVLLGRMAVSKMLEGKQVELEGRLISTPALKSTRVIEASVAKPSAPTPSGFENRPRFSPAKTQTTNPGPRSTNQERNFNKQ